MSGFSRRSFMQMLGLGGMALAVEAKAGPLPLFGSDEVEVPDLAVPDANLLRGHVVVQKKGITERIPPDDPVWARYGGYADRHNQGIRPVARITRTQVPGGGELHSLREHKLYAQCGFPEGVDPHVVYYKASHDLRAQFAELSRKRLMEVAPELRAGATIVTVVESPIMAVSRNGERNGFDVVAYFRQGIRYNTRGLNTFNIYSEQGEFPIEVPSDIDMGLLMKMDREVLADGSLLFGDPRSWRPSGRKLRPGRSQINWGAKKYGNRVG